MGDLQPNQIERLIDALSSAFNYFTLELLVTTKLDKRGLVDAQAC